MTARQDARTIGYAHSPQVAARIREFCGLDAGPGSRCVYLAAMGRMDGPHVTWGGVSPRPPERLEDLLAATSDIARSLWDTGRLLVFLDLDYHRADAPGDVYLHPADAFLKLEPVYRAILGELDALQLPLLDLMTGAGYGFVGAVSLTSPVVAALSALAPAAPAWHATHARRRPSWSTGWIDEFHARAHMGLGIVLEHFAHRVLWRVTPASGIPVVLDNTEVGWGPGGRECASLDLSHMGDPLDSRHVRAPFALYQKHRLRPDLFGEAAAGQPALVVVPRRRRPLLDMLEGARDLEHAAGNAHRTRAHIPDVEQGLRRLLECYAGSALARWHRDFYATSADPSEAGAPAGLPPCVAACLERPNDLLLKPTHLQNLVRTLIARGWSARRIAGLVNAQYSREGLWGEHWQRVDPATRADFEVRVFAGAVAMGIDRGVDFNCVSTQEKALCPGTGCGRDLRDDRDRMLGQTSG